MHPEIVRDRPGACPICGMALEPMTPTGAEAANPELAEMTRRFWVGVALSAPLLLLAMAGHVVGHPLGGRLSPRALVWVQFVAGDARWCCGAAGRSSCAAGSRSSTAASTCSR